MRTPQASEEGTVQRIAVFRALQFGDLLCAVPVLRALRRAHPHAHVTLIGLPSAEAFAHRFRHYIDDWMDFPGSAALPEQEPRAGRLPAFFAGARARRFDLALQLHGSGAHTNGIVRLLGARRSCGFRPGNSDTVDDDDFLPWPEDGSEIERLLRLVDHLGIERQGRSLEFPIGEDERRNWQRLAQRHSLDPQRLVLVHPGARLLLVCNDSGVSHVAVGVGARSVVVASGSEIRRWRPLDRSLHPMLAVDLPCRPCGEAVCPYAGHPCASAIDVEPVFELALHQLAVSVRPLQPVRARA